MENELNPYSDLPLYVQFSISEFVVTFRNTPEVVIGACHSLFYGYLLRKVDNA